MDSGRYCMIDANTRSRYIEEAKGRRSEGKVKFKSACLPHVTWHFQVPLLSNSKAQKCWIRQLEQKRYGFWPGKGEMPPFLFAYLNVYSTRWHCYHSPSQQFSFKWHYRWGSIWKALGSSSVHNSHIYTIMKVTQPRSSSRLQ